MIEHMVLSETLAHHPYFYLYEQHAVIPGPTGPALAAEHPTKKLGLVEGHKNTLQDLFAPVPAPGGCLTFSV